MVKTNFAAVINGKTTYFPTREAAKAAAAAAYEAKKAASAAYVAKKAKERMEAATLGRHQVRDPHTGNWVRFHTREAALAAQARWKEEITEASQSFPIWDEVSGGGDEDPWADLREELEEERRMEKEWDAAQAAKKKKGGRHKKAE